MVVSTFLHWLLSQCFLVVNSVSSYAGDKQRDGDIFRQLGFLRLPSLVAAIIGAVMFWVLIGLSFKTYKSAMPVVGSCSAAISAACHPPKEDDLDQATLGLVMWGETLGAPAWEMGISVDEIGEDRGHCSFTSLNTTIRLPQLLISFLPR